MSRTAKDTAAWAAAHRQRLADPLAHWRAWNARTGFDCDAVLAQCGADEIEWWWRNHQAIEMLQEVERIGCRTRLELLREFVEQLDDEALPLDFHKRLNIAARDAKTTADKAMAADRDHAIRFDGGAIYGEAADEFYREDGQAPHKYETAIPVIAKRTDHIPSAVKRAMDSIE